LLDLSIQSDEELLEDKWSALPNMILKHMRDRDFANALSQPLAWVVSYCYQHNGKVFVQSMLRSMIEYTSIMESDAFIEQVVQASPEVGDQIVTTYERLINQGKVEGKLEGKLEANANLIKNLIKDGFDDRRIAKLVEVDLSSVRAIRGNMVTT
jgi:predicted transposase YdaD